jgi:uncharacterized protein YndB with AHSA1/START domain
MTAHQIDTPPRTVGATIELPASPDDVWRAITDASEIEQWFCFHAEIEPRVGGVARHRWSDEFDWNYRVEAWEPGRRLRMVSRQERSDGPALLALEWLLEARGGSTVLRVVHSGFGHGADWDEEVNGTNRGWYGELRNLRHYLGRHRGARRSVAWVLGRSAGRSAEAFWPTVMGRDGFVAEGAVDGLAEGDHYRIRAATGEMFEGTVLMHARPTDFAGTVATLDDGLVRYGWEGPFITLWLATWNGDEAALDRFAEEWSARVERLGGESPEAFRIRG